MNTSPAFSLGRWLTLAASASVLTACVVIPPPKPENFPQGSKLSQRTDGSLCSVEALTKDLSEGSTGLTLTESCTLIEVKITNNNPEHPKKCVVQFGQQSNEVYLQVAEVRTLTIQNPTVYTPVFASCKNDWNRTR